ncbi:MAG: hypothetical protein V1873_08860 [Verrucomicrobiota bacterium]
MRILIRACEILSLLGLAGIAGLAGFYDYRLFHLSFLSFFSYFSFIRFLKVRIAKEKAPILVAILVPTFFSCQLNETMPYLGFLGFLGFLAYVLDKRVESQEEGM